MSERSISRIHLPAPTASDDEWDKYLRGQRYLPSTEKKPIANYQEFRGFWVPPRLVEEIERADGASGGGDDKPKRKRSAPKINKSWYTRRKLELLLEQHPDVFRELRAHFAELDADLLRRDKQEIIAEEKRRLDLSVEAGLMSKSEAAHRLKQWAEAEGLLD